MIAPHDGADEFDDGNNDAPYPPRDRLTVTTEDLKGQCRGIRTRCIVRDGTKGKDNHANATETAKATVRFKQ